MMEDERLWLDSFGFVYSGDGKRLLKGANVKGAYWIPEGVEEIEPGALIGCQIGTLHVPWTAHVHEHEQLVFSEDEEENVELMPAVYFWTKCYACRDDETLAISPLGQKEERLSFVTDIRVERGISLEFCSKIWSCQGFVVISDDEMK